MSHTREEDTVPQQVNLRMSHPGLFRLILTSVCVLNGEDDAVDY